MPMCLSLFLFVIEEPTFSLVLISSRVQRLFTPFHHEKKLARETILSSFNIVDEEDEARRS